MTCDPHELAIEHGSIESLHALVRWHRDQYHRITGGVCVEPDFDAIHEAFRPEPPAPAPDVVTTLERALWDEGVYRRPPRTAAPRLLELLAAAGVYLTTDERLAS